MDLFVLILVWDPDLGEVEDKGLKVCTAHIEQVLRNIVGNDIVENDSRRQHFLHGLALTTAYGKVMLHRRQHRYDLHDPFDPFFSQQLTTL